MVIGQRGAARSGHADQQAPTPSKICERVARTGVAENLVDVRGHPDYDPAYDESTQFQALQLLCAPLKSESGVVIAVLCVTKGWPKDDAPKELWSALRLEPFTKCVPLLDCCWLGRQGAS